MRQEAKFLLDRLDEYDPEDEDHVRDFHGHVSPAIARLRGALMDKPERERFEKAWAKRPWITEDESDKDRAWRWWQAALAADPSEHKLPGHDETMANLDALTIRK